MHDGGLWLLVEAVVCRLARGEKPTLVPLGHIMVMVRLLGFHRERTQEIKVARADLPAPAGTLSLHPIFMPELCPSPLYSPHRTSRIARAENRKSL